MKLRTYAVVVVCLSGLLCLLGAQPSRAQMYPQPPLMAPYTPGFNLGVFYVNAGLKYRNLQTVRFKIEPHDVWQTHSLGVPTFGPNTDGTLLYPYDAAAGLPTGNPTDDPDISGIWNYDDGYVDPRNPGTNPADIAFFPPYRALGHYNVPPSSVGSFFVAVPRLQTDNAGGTYAETTAVTFSRRIDGTVDPAFEPGPETPSRIFKASAFEETDIDFTNNIWTPYAEFGYRASSYFDCIFAISGFSNSSTFQRTYPARAELYRRTFRDTFHYDSSNTASNWLEPFDSDIPNGTTNPDETQGYVIYPAGQAGGVNLPTRIFSTELDPFVPPTAAAETLYNRIDFTAIEFKSGGRSWFPLYGMGEIGTSLGVLATVMPVTIVTSSRVVAVEDNAAAGVTAGDLLVYSALKKEDVWFWKNLGLFVGLDLRLASGPFFAQSTVEYDLYPVDNKYDDFAGVTTTVNISGLNGSLTVGTVF